MRISFETYVGAFILAIMLSAASLATIYWPPEPPCARSSIGQSRRLLFDRLQVRVLPGVPGQQQWELQMYDDEKEKLIELSPDLYVKPSTVEMVCVQPVIGDDGDEVGYDLIVTSESGIQDIHFESLADARRRAAEIVELINEPRYE